jgi:hypothetical protein
VTADETVITPISEFSLEVVPKDPKLARIFVLPGSLGPAPGDSGVSGPAPPEEKADAHLLVETAAGVTLLAWPNFRVVATWKAPNEDLLGASYCVCRGRGREGFEDQGRA